MNVTSQYEVCDTDNYVTTTCFSLGYVAFYYVITIKYAI
jgi:hypothetical protein